MGKYWKVASLDEETPKMVFEEYDDNNPTGRSMTFVKNIQENTLTVTQNPDEYMQTLRHVDGLNKDDPDQVAKYLNYIGYIFKTHHLEAKSIDTIMDNFYWLTPNPNGRQWFRSIENNLFDKTIVNFFANPRNFNINDPANLSPKKAMGGKKKKSRSGKKYRSGKKSRKARKTKKSRKSRKARKY